VWHLYALSPSAASGQIEPPSALRSRRCGSVFHLVITKRTPILSLMKRVLVPLAPGFEEIEAITVIDILRRAGVEVIVAGTQPAASRLAQNQTHPDCTLDQVSADNLDMIVLPGACPVQPICGTTPRKTSRPELAAKQRPSRPFAPRLPCFQRSRARRTRGDESSLRAQRHRRLRRARLRRAGGSGWSRRHQPGGGHCNGVCFQTRRDPVRTRQSCRSQPRRVGAIGTEKTP